MLSLHVFVAACRTSLVICVCSLHWKPHLLIPPYSQVFRSGRPRHAPGSLLQVSNVSTPTPQHTVTHAGWQLLVKSVVYGKTYLSDVMLEMKSKVLVFTIVCWVPLWCVQNDKFILIKSVFEKILVSWTQMYIICVLSHTSLSASVHCRTRMCHVGMDSLSTAFSR